ncbi:hypothetical protein EI94DRAFT_1887766 [Lactarius quietus]|nr:hypothetical protein EI94DRAFT_1887766 [Lactarius quietus]
MLRVRHTLLVHITGADAVTLTEVIMKYVSWQQRWWWWWWCSATFPNQQGPCPCLCHLGLGGAQSQPTSPYEPVHRCPFHEGFA